MIQYMKVKSAAKHVLTPGDKLTRIALETCDTIREIVGATLGPNGRPVLLERYEYDSPVFVTKDGVTVFRALGFVDPIAHAIMECLRDAASRTAATAGDGTTTAAVLGAELARRLNAFCSAHPRVSPQKAVRELERLFAEAIEPALKAAAKRPRLTDEEGHGLLHSVARMSANGDDPLAKAVMQCYDACGDAGHVSIIELSGPSHYEVEQMDGFWVPVGYEDTGAFYPKFVNDQGSQTCRLENPLFLLYHGELNDVLAVANALEEIGKAKIGADGKLRDVNVVVVATGFSEQVIGLLAANMGDAMTVSPFPLRVPKFPFGNGQKQFLDDLAAVTGATVLDPIDRPLDDVIAEDFGPGVKRFEASRWKSVIYGVANEDEVAVRAATLIEQAKNPVSEMDAHYLNERIGRLTGGIARLKIFGGSNAETREKRDRADDAVCAVRSALQGGCLPGGGWGLMRATIEAMSHFGSGDMAAVAREVLVPALRRPMIKMLENCGYSQDEIEEISAAVTRSADDGAGVTYDAFEGRYCDAYEAGILDSLPAVVEAIRNGISAAAFIGTLGGVVVFPRDSELERKEAHEAEAWKRDTDWNPANDRA